MMQTATKPDYRVICTKKMMEGAGEYTCYGIGFCDSSGQSEIIEDVSLCREQVERLAALCNRLEISPLHIRDVIEDFLADAP